MCSIPRWGYRSPAPHLGPQHQEHVGVGGGRKLLNRVGGRLLGLVRVWVIWVQGFIGVRAEDTWDLSSRFGHVLTWVPSWMGSEKSLV